MGIDGLLPRLSSITHSIHLSAIDATKIALEAEGGSDQSINLRVAIDVSCWISAACHVHGSSLLDERHLTNSGRHEISERLSSELDENTAVTIDIPLFIEQTTKSVMRKVKSIKFCLSPNILVVLDGASPPIKANTVSVRHKGRELAAQESISIQRVSDSIEQGIDVDDLAHQANHKRISAAKRAGARDHAIYGAVVNSIISTLRAEKVPFLVSPFEADGELAYLSRRGYIDLIVSEDSDFIPLAAKSVLYKYDPLVPFMDDSDEAFSESKATGKLINYRELMFNSDQSFILLNFNRLMISLLCIASGCDYCKQLKGIGLVTARTLVEEVYLTQESIDKDIHPIEKFLIKLFQKCKEKLDDHEREKYKENFLHALVMYLHPIVFDPIQGKCVISDLEVPNPDIIGYEPYRKLIEDIEKLQSIVGKLYDNETGIYVAEGWVDPKTWKIRDESSVVPVKVMNFYERALENLNKESETLEYSG